MDRVGPAPDTGLWTAPATVEMTPDSSPALPQNDADLKQGLQHKDFSG
jgi:hypothetical protein